MSDSQINVNSVQIDLTGNYGPIQHVGSTFDLIGHAFLGDEKLTVESLMQHVEQSISAGSLLSLLQALNGFYAFIYRENGTVYAVTDRLRSRPLFYTNDKQNFYLSDSISWLNDQFSGKSANAQGQDELIRAGYISGEDTLINEVKQLEAASLITYSNGQINREKYHHFIPKNGDDDYNAQHSAFALLDNALSASINRLIAVADNRQIVIPLSGGYDSRIIALYLKQAGYNNITCFTFGKKNSQEVKFSHKIALGLGLPWHFVQYRRKLWNTEKKSKPFKHFLLFISSFVSVPNVQVYPAIKALLERGVIEQDAIIVPGHTGDFSSGGHMPVKLIRIPARGNHDIIVDSILTKHYRYQGAEHRDRALVAKITAQIELIAQAATIDTPAASLFEAWECNERQAKFIVNSNRYYDYWGLDWWMPLWDNQLISFWKNASLAERKQSLLWQRFIDLKCREMLGDEAPQGNAAMYFSPFWQKVRSILDFFTDDNELYALVPFHRWLFHKMKIRSANGTVFSYLAEQISKTQKKQIK